MHEIIKEFPWVDRTSWNRPFSPEKFDSQFNNLFLNSKISDLFERIKNFVASVLRKEKKTKDSQKK